MKHLFYSALAISLLAPAFGINAKRPLNHDDFDSWQRVKVNAISQSGNWSAFTVEPQEGDGVLTLRDNRKGRTININRGYKPAFSADGNWAITLIKPHFADTRKGKIDKKKDFDLPQDSLAIIDLKTGRIEKIANVIGYKIGKKGGNFVAYQSCDTLHIKPAQLKDKEAGKPLVVRSLTSPVSKIVKWVEDYEFSRDGSKLALSIATPEADTLSTDGVAILNLPDTSMILLDRDKKFYTLPVFNEAATALAYTASNDSSETGTIRADLYYVTLDGPQSAIPSFNFIPTEQTSRQGVNLQPPHSSDPQEQAKLEQERAEIIRKSEGDRLYANQYSRPMFSKSGRFLTIGIAPPVAPDDTTLVDFEKADIDIWRWDAPFTPPQEKKNLSQIREKSLPLVIDLENGMSQQLLTKNLLDVVEPSFGWNSEWALIHDPSQEIVSRQWNYLAPENLTMVNVVNGERRPVTTAKFEESVLSPDGRFVVWFDDRNYHAYDVTTGQTVNLTRDMEYPVWNEDDDHPMPSQEYGIATWGDGDNRMLIYDRHDIWSLDLTGKESPICITAGEGRKKNLKFRYYEPNEDRPGLKKGDLMILEVFDLGNMERGLATTTYGRTAAPSIKILDKYRISQFKKAENADVFIWQKANFETLPDLWTVNSTDFNKAVKITSANPQAKDILWGTAELVEWYTYDGKKAKGILYKPENFNPEGSYPLLAYFYEKYSDELYRDYTMEPSWSWINFPFYVSRGYMIFVPDISYTAGIPGECAYNYICSGVEELCKQYPAIDKKRIGIDGQSWGGYQTAYLVTRTNMFACAGSGAPVANMTSAFGGIRWESGDSRQPQYEMGQSRIGQNLWDAPELYIANSPLFKANRVETPLLIMHNDADGAVPWYQGIELFMALRRLQKPVWMLQYNSEAHNIRERRNRKDITKRLQQFFDHYLMGAPMPRWMKEGISPLRKGQDYGF